MISVFPVMNIAYKMPLFNLSHICIPALADYIIAAPSSQSLFNNTIQCQAHSFDPFTNTMRFFKNHEQLGEDLLVFLIYHRAVPEMMDIY